MNTAEDHGGVVITGASSGIGRVCAIYLAQKGFQVFGGVRKQVDADVLATAHPHIIPLILDVTNTEQIAQSVETVQAAVGAAGIVGLVNNAGVTASGPVEFLPVDDLRALWEVNVIGVVAITQAFLPLLRQARRGRVINMSSFGGTISSPYLSAYHASKFALEALSDALRMELAQWPTLDVVVIKPASIQTPIWQKAVDDYEALLKRMPPQARDYYEAELAIVTAKRQQAEADGDDPQIVAEAVYQALTKDKPPTRRLLAFNPFLFAGLRWIPDRWRDRIVRKSLGL